MCCMYPVRVLGCEGDGNASVGSGGDVVAVGECMGGTRGSGDVLEMSVVRGVCGVCDMCMCLARCGVGGEGGGWMRGLSLGFTNPVGTGGVWDVCLRLGCSGLGGVGGEWVGDLDQSLEGWGGVMSVWGVTLDYLCR